MEQKHSSKRRGGLIILTTLSSLGLILGGVSPAAQAAAYDVVIKGHVTTTSGKAVGNVIASVYYRVPSSGQYHVERTRTSKTGRYEVRVPESFGDYKLKVNDPGDKDRDNADGRWAPALHTFDFSGSASVQNIKVQPGAKLSGRIYDRNGHPVKAGLRVYATGTSQIGGPVTYTRDGGAYYFSNLVAGQTSVLVESPSTNGSSRWYQRNNSAGSVADTNATKLSLVAGKKTTGVSIYFPAVSKITGRVTVDGVQPSGEGGPNVITVLYDAQGNRLSEYFTNPTFHLLDLAPGTYYLGFESPEITPEYYENAPTLTQATPIVVRSGGAVTGIVANLASKP